VPKNALHRHIAARIKELSKQRGWSGNRLADFAGVSKAQVARILALQTSPTVATMEKIANALGVKPSDLMPH